MQTDTNMHKEEQQTKITSYQEMSHSSRPLNNRGPCGCSLEDEFDSEIRFSVQTVLDTLLPAVLYDEIDFK